MKSYCEEFYYTNFHITKIINVEYNLFIFKNYNCINELSLDIDTIDFDSCYNKIKHYYYINDDLIIIYFEKYDIYNPVSAYILCDPANGEILNFQNICLDVKTVTIEDNIFILLNKNMNILCNKMEGFYPLIFPGKEQIHYQCFNSLLRHKEIYFDSEKKIFKPCYKTCTYCNMEGNKLNPNCIDFQDSCNIEDFFSDRCEEIDDNLIFEQDNMIKKIQNEFQNKYSIIWQIIENSNDKDLIVRQNNIAYTISSSENQNNNKKIN